MSDAPTPPAPDPALRPDPAGEGTLLVVRVQPGARRSALAGEWDGLPRLAVRARAQGGRANDELVALVAELFGLRPSAVRLVRGHSSRTKTLRLALAPAAARPRLEALRGNPAEDPP